MAITRHATAHWEGDLKTGQGKLDTPQSGLMAGTRYGFNTRFGGEKGTNPEELIAAAHAGCFTMALSAKLTEAGHPPRIARHPGRRRTVDGRRPDDLRDPPEPHAPRCRAWTTRSSARIADDAKQNCPVSKALSAVPISLEAELVG